MSVPLFIDVHEVRGVTTEAAAAAHIRDSEVQTTHGADIGTYGDQRARAITGVEQAGPVHVADWAPNA